MKILSAEYVVPISRIPIEDGAVAIENDQIIAVGRSQDLVDRFPGAICEDFGDSAILPGFVNCHSHLELTAMRGFLDEFDDDFSAWLLKLTKVRAEKLTAEDIETAALAGALEGARAGVTCFGDIGRQGSAGFNALRENGLRGIVFQETEFSPDNKTAEEDFLKLQEKFLEMRSEETALVKTGISPHAPYTVSRRLFERIADYAMSENFEISIHAAESVPETQLMRTGRGFFAEVYEKQNVNWESPKCSTIEYLDRIGVLRAKPLLAHCVKVSAGDIEKISRSGSRIAHCPKSNAKFGHGAAPFEKFLAKKIAVGLGSDSMASNNSCDLLEEARFAALLARTCPGAQKFPHAQTMIETATLGGARTLGLENEIGTIEPGKHADLIVISLGTVAQMPVHNIYSALLFASGARDIRMTMVAGEEIYRDGISKRIDEARLKIRISKIARKMDA